MRLMPRSGSRAKTRAASAGFEGGPHTPFPVMRMAPKPSLLTVTSPPTRNEPEDSTVRVVISGVSIVDHPSRIAHDAAQFDLGSLAGRSRSAAFSIHPKSLFIQGELKCTLFETDSGLVIEVPCVSPMSLRPCRFAFDEVAHTASLLGLVRIAGYHVPADETSSSAAFTANYALSGTLGHYLNTRTAG